MHSKTQNTIVFYTKIKYPNADNILSNITIPLTISFTDGTSDVSEYVYCYDLGEHIESYCTYRCQLNVKNNNVSKVKLNDIENKYSLSSLANVTKDISSQKSNNFLNIKDISLLNHSSIFLKSGRHFIIKGELLESEYESKSIKLITSKNTFRKDLSCKGYIDRVKLVSYYFLDCDTSESSINMDLQNTFAYFEDNKDKGILIHFDDSNNSTAIQTNDYIPKKKSSGLSTGGIIAILISCIILLFLVGGLIYFLKGRAPTPPLKEIVKNNNTIGASGASSEVVVNQ